MKSCPPTYIILMALLATHLSCNKKDYFRTIGKEHSTTDYYPKFKERSPAPGLVLIPGGTFILGHHLDRYRKRQVSVQSFYMDEMEVTNLGWRNFVKDVRENGWKYRDETSFDEYSFQDIDQLLPDTNVWKRIVIFNDPYLEAYYSHPAFDQYPVIGINWHQANEYCRWRTYAVNKQIRNKNSTAITYPSYRLPTEAEWEYAARGLSGGKGNLYYKWESTSIRNRKGKYRVNFNKGPSKYVRKWSDGRGIGDPYLITAPVDDLWANDFGLYHMSGNVSEWTQDSYSQYTKDEGIDFYSTYDPYAYQSKKTNSWLEDYEQQLNASKSARALATFNLDDPYVASDSIPLLFDDVKVYRGGSWADIVYYTDPGVRRGFPADSASARIGFRCAMIRIGYPY